MDSFQCTGTFKEKTGKISKAPQEFVGDSGKAQQSSGTAATAASAHSRQAAAFGRHNCWQRWRCKGAGCLYKGTAAAYISRLMFEIRNR